MSGGGFFCPRCDVVVDLHYGEDDCYGAGLRADLLSAGDRLLGHVPSGGSKVDHSAATRPSPKAADFGGSNE